MKIKLSPPFSLMWRIGYLVTNKENRRNVLLYNNRHDRTTISYARYIYCVAINAFIPSDTEVDHIDGDKTNDTLQNLQLLSKADNIKKQHIATKNITKGKHGTLSCYRYCKCTICKKGKSLYSAGKIEEYYALISSHNL